MLNYFSYYKPVFKITGNSGADHLEASGYNDILDGRAGADVMVGHGGDDIYYVDNAKDHIVEFSGEGTDTVYSSVSYTLEAGQSVERLYASNAGVTTALKLIGNELANVIKGNAGVNTLDGKAGADAMYGYGGNDAYYVDNAGDRVFEAVGGGTDTVVTSVSYTLAAGQEIEKLQLAATVGTGAFNLTGNEFANTLLGSAGANILSGGGGADLLYGYGGADSFVFDTALGSGNVDRIADFSKGEDKIVLDHTVFTALSVGTLQAAAFKEIGTGGATDADDLVIYNHDSGALFYDTNGATAGGLVQFATLIGHPSGLTNLDFVVVA